MHRFRSMSCIVSDSRDVMATISVVLVENHEATRLGLRTILEKESGVVLVGEATNSRDAICRIGESQPDVAILDIRLQEGTGIDVCRSIPSVAPDTKILIFTAYDDDHYVRALVNLGIRGYLTKSCSTRELLRAFYDVAEGRLAFSPCIAKRVIGLLQGERERSLQVSSNHNLTSREAEVLAHIGQGLKDREIAESLGISLRTVETHVRNLLRKLRATSRTHALLIAIKAGWIQNSSPR